MSLPNGYTEFNEAILESWVAKGIQYVTERQASQPMYGYGGESAFELIPHIQLPDESYYQIDSDYIQGIAADPVDLVVYIVHEDNL
jgi:hypothetical protein